MASRPLILAWLCALTLAGPAAAATGGPDTSPVHRAGRWLVDGQGRVYAGHGFNLVKKLEPFVYTGFGAADARLLADEGFTVVRLGVLWAGVEPQPGHYDDAYIDKLLALDRLLGRYGIRTVLDAHQDLWNDDGPPKWATLGGNPLASFAAFWRDDDGPGGVGIQTRFDRMWHHVATRIASRRNVIGIDPFNEPQAGSDYACAPFNPCTEFESSALATFYQRVIAAIRAGGAHQVIFPEGIPSLAAPVPSLPAFADPQTAFQYHFYCAATQFSSSRSAVGAMLPEAQGCQPLETTNVAGNADYADGLGAPAYLGEFSCTDVNQDNAQYVDAVDARFQTWTVWSYYAAAEDPANCPGQTLLENDAKPGSQRNAKQDKLDALAVPHAQAIAGTPATTGYDRDTREYTLTYATAAVPGAHLAPRAPTQIFVPARAYPRGYAVSVEGGSVVSQPGAPWLLIRAARAGQQVSVRVVPSDNGPATRRPLATGVLPIAASRRCVSQRRIVFHLAAGAHLRSVTVNGRRITSRARRRAVRVDLRGRGGTVRIVVRIRHRGGTISRRVVAVHRCRG